jgi:hypothetical protein
MTAPEAKRPETIECRCPSCRSERVMPVGHVLATDGLIKLEQRCEVCGTTFFLVRKAFT